jgi:2-isopropylmalate synthase
MNQREKMEIAVALERMGVDVIEAGFPVISKGDFDSVFTVAKKIKTSRVAGLARSVKPRRMYPLSSVSSARMRVSLFMM